MNENTAQIMPAEQEQQHPEQEAEQQAAADAQEQGGQETAAESGADAQREQPNQQDIQGQGEAEKPAAEASGKGAETAEDEQDARTQLETLTRQTAAAELRAAAALAGVPAAKIPYVVRMCDAGALGTPGEGMEQAAAAQVAKVLQDVPELAGGLRELPGSLGDHRQTGVPGESAEDKIRAAFASQLR